MAGLLCGSAATGCKGFLDIDPPRGQQVSHTVFQSDETARAAMLGMYTQLGSGGFASGNASSITFYAALSSDELLNYSITGFREVYEQFNTNALMADNTAVGTLWSEPYQLIYRANAVLEGVAGSIGLSAGMAQQLSGEALFLRAFAHVYLAGLFGDVPLVTGTDYRINAQFPRRAVADVYRQAVADLKEAQQQLPEDYRVAGGRRIRANAWAATALLARVYLYLEEWEHAAAAASAVLDQTALYSLAGKPEDCFLRDSPEAIWQLVRYVGGVENNAPERAAFTFTARPFTAALRPAFVTSFEAGDRRRTAWVGSTTVAGETFYFPAKYRSVGNTPVTEHSVVLRLAEQYLIRAEAYARQGLLAESIADVDRIRARAGLPLISETRPGLSREELLNVIVRERKAELPVEWGHRWFDLKRYGQAAAVLAPIKSGWQPAAALYPIPAQQLLNNPSMTEAQNPGYSD